MFVGAMSEGFFATSVAAARHLETKPSFEAGDCGETNRTPHCDLFMIAQAFAPVAPRFSHGDTSDVYAARDLGHISLVTACGCL